MVLAADPVQMPPPEGRPEDPGGCPDTDALVAGGRGGDRAAFDELYERTAPAIHAWSCLRIHPSLRGRLEPEDIVQETWWRALESFRTFDRSKGAFRTWLFQIAKNTLLNAFRSLRVRGEVADGTRARRVRELPEHLAVEATSVSRKAARSEEARLLLDAVLEIPEADRALVACCALEGLSVSEAAEILGISHEAAKKRWARLKTRLRAELSP